ncbi:Erythrocyte ankyrin [Cladobotryum mycophilum]|uniref:Erythrocyte ankyrin n=1 Tax=Cladobotryum mycophilum TaxID=491253 RepID=A0ABR0SAZ2_9HYPO
MEPVGLAVGVIGLASLFGACLDAVDKIDDYKHYKNDSHSLATQFKAHKLRFEQWGKSVGIDRNKSLTPDHHEALDDQSTLETVLEILSIIKRVCNFEDEGPPPHNLQLGKIKRTAQIEQFGTLVQHLYHLVPPKAAMRVRPADTSQPPAPNIPPAPPVNDSSVWISELRQSLKRVEEEIEADARREVHAWLIRDPPNELYDDNIQKRLVGTCDWITSRDAFTDWFSPDFPSQRAKLLWVNGPAGFGKTVLCSSVISFLSSNISTPVGHFFFSSDFESRNDPYIAVRSWISQAISRDNAAFDFVRERRDAQNEQVATRTAILQIFRQLVQIVPGCTFILDGLDECTWLGQSNSSRGDSIVDFLGKLGTAVANSSSRVLIVSRDEPDIRSGIENTKFNVYEYKISPEDVQGDVEIYSKSLVDKKLSKKSEAIKNAISQRMAERCGGQFLWLRMQEDSLRGWKNQKQLEDTIDKTPPGLDNLYERNLLRLSQLPQAERDRAFSLLRWATFALRPLTVCEIAEAVLIDMDGEELPVDEMPDEVEDEYINSEILGLCGSLLNIRQSSSETNPGLRTVRITHFSVKQYFLSHSGALGNNLQANESLRFSNEEAENTMLARLCLRYVHYEEVWQEDYRQGLGHVQGAFLDYAADSWSRHLRLGDLDDEDANELIDALFDVGNPTWEAWRSWFDSNEKASAKMPEAEEDDTKPRATSTTPVYYAAKLDLTTITMRLIEEYPDCLDEQSITGTTALVAACENGNEGLVRALTESGANVTLQNFMGKSPLHAVADDGRIHLAQVLLDNGADVTLGDVEATTPLSFAASEGHMEMARLLIEHGADVMTPNMKGSTPLHWSAAYGHVDVSRLLLDKGADLGFKSSLGQTPMYSAAIRGHIEPLRLLLERGAHVDTVDEDGITPLMSAAYFGFSEVTRLLIKHGADPNAKDNRKRTPLHYVAESGHLEVVRLLIENGADLRYSERGTPPIITAAWFGQVEVIRLLLDYGAQIDISMTNEEGEEYTVMNAAIMGNCIDIVKLLLERGVQPSTRIGADWTPMTMACHFGKLQIIDILFHHGANTSDPDSNGWAPLDAAISGGEVEVAELLLKKGADLTVMDRYGQTPLRHAILLGESEIVRLLIENGADIEDEDDNGCKPLHWAATSGDTDIMQHLVDLGCDITPTDPAGWTPLHHAAGDNQIEAVKFLIRNGADATALTNNGLTLLHLAARDGNIELVELLLATPGIRASQADDYGRTALFYASMRGYVDVVRLLLLNKAEVNTKDLYNSSAIFAATRNGHQDVVETLLVAEGVDVVSKDHSGKTLLWWARRCGNHSVVELVESAAGLNDLETPDDGFVGGHGCISFNSDEYWCDVCTRCIPAGSDYFECSECDGGDFLACIACVGGGTKCRAGSHEWTMIMSTV